MSEVLYSRSEAGLLTVTIEGGSEKPLYRVVTQEGVSTEYRSARSMLKALTGHPEARHWTLDRYFKIGKYQDRATRVAELPGNRPSLSVLDLWIPDSRLTVASTSVETPASITVLTAPRLGVDLVTRGHEVAKLFYAGFGARVARAGYDPQDVLQEVYKGILIRNQGTCPWDIRKSSFGHYVHMVCGCIVSNYFRRENRRRAMEQVGVVSKDGSQVDVASDDALLPVKADKGVFLRDDDALLDYLDYIRSQGTPEARAHLDVALLMCDGANRLEAARSLGLPVPLISRLYQTFRKLLNEWFSTPDYA